MIAQAVRDLLQSDTDIKALTGKYAGKAAVFLGGAVPNNYDVDKDGGAITIGGALGTQNQDTFDDYYTQETYRIRCYAQDGRERAQALGKAAKDALHDKPLTVSGLEISGMTATRPVTAPTTSLSVEGRIVNLTILLKET